MNLARGVHVRTDGMGNQTIQETFTCCHCNAVKPTPKAGEDFGFCSRCFARTCANDRCGNRCRPFELALLKMEARARFLAAVGIQ